jgi:hypothetical protein
MYQTLTTPTIGRKENEMNNYYLTFDAANGAANMRNHENGKLVGGWYVKRHYRTCNGERIGEWFSIHKRRAAK